MVQFKARPFQTTDQDRVFALIMTGLGQRFDEVKPEHNPDLFDIQTHYIDRDATFIVVETDDQLIGCGALIKENSSKTVARIVRVSVHADYQGRGLGRTISEKLLATARERGFSKVLVETNQDWTSALRLYKALGFRETHRVKADAFDFIEVHMALAL